jgi:iron complex transport system permease protein
MCLGALLLLVAAAASLAVGSKTIPLGEVLNPSTIENLLIVKTMRLPRTLVGIEVGIALAGAGAIMQALTRNPIAEPRILGISAGASTGVVIAIALAGVSTLSGWIWWGMLGAAAAGARRSGSSARSTGADTKKPFRSRWSY